MVSRPRAVQRPVRRPAPTDDAPGRLPPGQVRARRWPVLHQGEVPPFDPTTWSFRIDGLVRVPLSLDWAAFSALPLERVRTGGDLHCVTRWSKLDNDWHGFRAADLLALADPLPMARFAVLHGEGGYTANVPLAALRDPAALLATGADGNPLAPEHGAPLRAVIPALYAWKSVKWLLRIEVLAEDRPGFWEGYGYSNSADAWKEERFADGDPGPTGPDGSERLGRS
jgi:DMSO/TMAO reductase YedYZ molybdopterin-dependent catalytic subunit